MAAVAFDTLAYVRRIVAAGVPREQAEAQADAMEFSVEKRFAEQDARIDLKFEGINGQFRLIYWMLAVVIASTVIPAIQQLYSAL